VLQDGKLFRLYAVPLKFGINRSIDYFISYGLGESRDGKHAGSSDDAHQRVEVADVDALPGHFDPLLDCANASLLLASLRRIIE